jgi:signal transduction histidine kinase
LKSELNDVKSRSAEAIHKAKENKLRLTQEKEKLLMHIQASAEGICFFNPDRTVAFYNGLFLQYFNIISHDSINVNREMLGDEVFAPVRDFLKNNPREDYEDYFETRISKQGSEFSVRVNVFADGSFEIILADITYREKTRRLKQEMTGNIAHELRTPITSIRGFLEIILNNNISDEKRTEYLERAYSQTQTLSELIADMNLLTKIDERTENLRLGKVNVCKLLKNVQTDMASALKEKNIRFCADISEDLFIAGNDGLVYSIFRNLTDNAIRYGGENISISIRVYETKDSMAYFIFSDNGKGVEKDIPLERLFERFYRVEEGRPRDTGGSGLGLSIVKNAVLFHKGTITVRSGSAGGLEFMFSLPVA